MLPLGCAPYTDRSQNPKIKHFLQVIRQLHLLTVSGLCFPFDGTDLWFTQRGVYCYPSRWEPEGIHQQGRRCTTVSIATSSRSATPMAIGRRREIPMTLQCLLKTHCYHHLTDRFHLKLPLISSQAWADSLSSLCRLSLKLRPFPAQACIVNGASLFRLQLKLQPGPTEASARTHWSFNGSSLKLRQESIEASTENAHFLLRESGWFITYLGSWL